MKYLSHYLNNDTPKYAGNQEDLRIQDASCMCNGDTANSLFVQMKNHVGTHIDLPKHFDDQGKTLNSYEPSFWFFQNPQLLNLPMKEGQLIEIEMLLNKINETTDFLIIKTGFESFRNEDKYWNANPGVNEGVGVWLRENYPYLKVIGFDFISLSSFKHRPIGRIAHKEFLSSELKGSPILIVEDMKLASLKESPKSLIVSPLLLDNADGVQVTIFAN